MMAPLEDIRGKKFARLVAVAFHSTAPNGHARWVFSCDCGEERVIVAASVKHLRSRSCGCLRLDSNRSRAKRQSEKAI